MVGWIHVRIKWRYQFNFECVEVIVVSAKIDRTLPKIATFPVVIVNTLFSWERFSNSGDKLE